MILDVHDDVEVAVRTAARARFALAVEAQALAGRDAGRNADGELALLLHAPRAPAGGARLGDDRAGAAALAAGARHREEPLLIAQLSAALALRAGGRLRVLGGARPVAGLARLLAGNLHRGLGALGGFDEGNLEVVAQIGAALRAAAPAAAAEDVAEAEHVAQAAEDVLEAGEDVGIDAAGGGAAQAGVAEAVVHVALVGVGEHRVGLRALLEPLFRDLVPGIPVRVVLQRELAVGALDLLVRRGTLDGQYLVVVAFAHELLATFTVAGRSSRSPSM
jgi:hypothetical protein